jgi:penicillin-binding protein 1A
VINESVEHGWRQHFPTYNFENRDIAIEEYKTAAKSLEAEERVFLNASNIAVIASAGLGSLAVGSLDKLTNSFANIVPASTTLSILVLLTGSFSWVALRYFADRQKSVVFAARKVIVLRRMLGLNYGTIQLVLPNWRIEGADEPFAVRLFPGWNTYVTYPFYALAGISSAVLYFLLASLMVHQSIVERSDNYPPFAVLVWAIFLAFVYRKALLDTHEKSWLLFACSLSRTLQLSIVNNIEYVIYRATLARYEFIRLRVDLVNLKKLLVFIEDRGFFSHHGISIKALVRALLGLLKLKRRSGGSTITQQLGRTLFIVDQSKLFRRKFIEILFALWVNCIFSKDEQLELYLASVRFERGVYGAIDAMHHYWGRKIANPTKAESFFLIERVSNIYSLLLTDKIIQIARLALDAGLMKSEDIKELIGLYRNSILDQKIFDPNGGIDRMLTVFDPVQQKKINVP